MADIGTGASLTLGTSGTTFEILSISGNDASVPVIDTTHLGSTTQRSKMTGELIDHGTVDVEILFDPDDPPPLGVTETITVTFPLPSGQSTAADYSGSASITSRNWTVPLEDRMTGSFTITWLGAIT